MKSLIIDRITLNEIASGMTLRDITQKGWKTISRGKAFDAAIKELEDDHIISIREIQNPSGGRGKRIILVNPIFKEFC